MAIIGAGPIGLEAGVRGLADGWEVTIYERGGLAHNVWDWGHVRLFSPFGMNSSTFGRELLQEAGCEIPAETAILTGREFVTRYLEPLAQVSGLAERLKLQTKVRRVGRRDHWKGQAVGDPIRERDPFALLVRTEGEERIDRADVVLDCSGSYPNSGWIGRGGIPCLGEEAAHRRFRGRLPDLHGRDREQYAGKATLMVGSGYSAATVAVQIAELARSAPNTTAVWLTRGDRSSPVTQIPKDTLPERDRLAKAANELVRSTEPNQILRWLPGHFVEEVRYGIGDGVERFAAKIEGPELSRWMLFDEIFALVGYRPDTRLYEELHVHQCYGSEGPMRLAATRQGSTGDCLDQALPAAEALRTTEPGFFILGAKSYGRDSRFLIRLGLEQVEAVFDLLNAPGVEGSHHA